MKIVRLMLCAGLLALAGCGGGGGTTTTTCTIIAAPSVSYATPSGGVYVGTTQSYSQGIYNYVSSPCTLDYSATNLPAGLAIDPKSGLISGSISSAGTTTAVVTATARGTDGSSRTGVASLTFVALNPVAWTLKTANHNIGSLGTHRLATIGNTVYMVGSSLNSVTNNYVPVMYQSVDGGATWTNSATTAPAFTSLVNFTVVADSGAIYLVGGRTSNASVTTAASYTYNDAVLKYTPGNPGSWSTVSSNPFVSLAIANSGGREQMALAWDGSALYAYGGVQAGTVSQGVYKSTDSGVTWAGVNDASSYALYGQCLMSPSAGVLYSIGGRGFSPAATVATDYTVALKSTNAGKTWSLVNSSVPTQAMYASCGTIKGRLYAMGGTNSGLSTFSGDVYQSIDQGITWNRDPSSSVFGVRAYQGSTVLNGSFVILGGFNFSARLTDVIQGTP